MDNDGRKNVEYLLQSMCGLDDARKLFCELKHDPAYDRLFRDGWSAAARDALTNDPKAAGAFGDFGIMYSRLASVRLLLGLERLVLNCLLRDHLYALFLFCTRDPHDSHLVNVRYDNERRPGCSAGSAWTSAVISARDA